MSASAIIADILSDRPELVLANVDYEFRSTFSLSAISNGSHKVARMMAESNPRQIPLMLQQCVSQGSASCTRMLLEVAAAKMGHIGGLLGGAMLFSASQGPAEQMLTLLEAGADPFSAYPEGPSAIDIAIKAGNEEKVAILRAAQARAQLEANSRRYVGAHGR